MLLVSLLLAWPQPVPAARLPAGKIRPVKPATLATLPLEAGRRLHVWSDTCNVYVLQDGESALLVDLGEGSVLDQLPALGIKQVEWVLFTHHHREQCQGIARLAAWGARVAGPEAERALFERPADFRKMKVALGDAYTIHGASYVRPSIQPIPLDRGLKKMDVFDWHGSEIWCVDTRGNSPGAMSYFLRDRGRWLAFSGDVMLAGGKLHQWFDSEWDYGFAAGLYALISSASMVASYRPSLLLPAHGDLVAEPGALLALHQKRLRRLARLLVRGYEINTFGAADQDVVSRPSRVPHLWQITPHLFKFKGPDYWPNFTLLLADSGHALLVDCGLADRQQLDRALALLKERYGLQQIDAVFITHMHGDHFLDVPYLREKYGAQAWTLDKVAILCRHPGRYDLAAPIQAYGAGFDSLACDREFTSGERFTWEGYTFTVDWMPGQTYYGCALHGIIDGRRVAFTGDNLFGNPADPAQTGHEAVVAHNRAILEEGYILGADLLKRIQPDLIVGGHSYVMNRPRGLIERFGNWSRQMRAAFQAVSAEADYRYSFDPFWVRAEPLRLSAKPGQAVETTLVIANFQGRPQRHRLVLSALPDIEVEAPVREGSTGPNSITRLPVRLRIGEKATPGIHLVAIDVTRDGRRLGQLFDFFVNVEKP